MLNYLSPLLYVQLSPDRLSVRNVKTGVTIAERPDIAVSQKPRRIIIAVGDNAQVAAQASGALLLNPFAHPRSIISDFTTAEQVLKHFVKRSLGNGVFSMAPRIVMHPMGEPEGGFTQVEMRALRELGEAVGASKVGLWTGKAANDKELLDSRTIYEGWSA
jgi:rod shape-determining protein MreB and related proteins